MAVIHSFFDESGKFSDQKVVSFCGLCATTKQLEQFDEAWKDLLRRYGMPWLTMKRALKPNVALGKHARAIA